MRKTSIYCDRCGDRTEAPSVVEVLIATEPRSWPIDLGLDLCQKCVNGLLEWLLPMGGDPEGEAIQAAAGPEGNV